MSLISIWNSWRFQYFSKKRLTVTDIITARKRSLGQGNIFTPVCHSVHRGGMHGCSGGGMRGCSEGVCVVAPGGGVYGIRWDTEIRSMSGRYASYWNAFFVMNATHFSKGDQFHETGAKESQALHQVFIMTLLNTMGLNTIFWKLYLNFKERMILIVFYNLH